METAAGYRHVRTPHLTKESLFQRSGHLPYYADSMYPPMEMEGVRYYIKPMNCPMHHKIYGSEPRSYRDLPLRLAEYGTCYRYEKSGELMGLMRVRSMQMNDAHIYCSEEQFASEFMGVIDLYLHYFRLFGIEQYQMRLSTHHPRAWARSTWTMRGCGRAPRTWSGAPCRRGRCRTSRWRTRPPSTDPKSTCRFGAPSAVSSRWRPTRSTLRSRPASDLVFVNSDGARRPRFAFTGPHSAHTSA